MSEIINLRQHRKSLLRNFEATAAAENRARFGRSALQKSLDEQVRLRRDRLLTGSILTDTASAGNSKPSE